MNVNSTGGASANASQVRSERLTDTPPNAPTGSDFNESLQLVKHSPSADALVSSASDNVGSKADFGLISFIRLLRSDQDFRSRFELALRLPAQHDELKGFIAEVQRRYGSVRTQTVMDTMVQAWGEIPEDKRVDAVECLLTCKIDEAGYAVQEFTEMIYGNTPDNRKADVRQCFEKHNIEFELDL